MNYQMHFFQNRRALKESTKDPGNKLAVTLQDNRPSSISRLQLHKPIAEKNHPASVSKKYGPSFNYEKASSADSSPVIQRMEKKMVAMTIGGGKETQWVPHPVNWNTLTIPGARELLQNIKLGEMKGTEDEIERLRNILSSAVHEELINWEDIQWAVANGVVFRFHTDTKTLTEEYDRGELKGHKCAIYNIDPMIEETRKKIIAEPEQNISEMVREFQQRIIEMSVSAVSHAENSSAKSSSFVIAQSALPTKDIDDKLTPWADKVSWLADTSLLAIKASQLKTINTECRSFGEFYAAVTSVTDLVLNYIKSRGGTRTAHVTRSSAEIPNRNVDKALLPDEDKQERAHAEQHFTGASSAAVLSKGKEVKKKGIFTLYENGKWYDENGDEYRKREDEDGFCWCRAEDTDDTWLDEKGRPDMR